MPELSWKHHTLIQVLLSRGPLKGKEFFSIFTSIAGKLPAAGNRQRQFNDYLLRINQELAYVQFELRGCRDQYDGNICYGVVNNVADEQSKLGTKYSVPQIAFYKGVIEAIVQDATAQGSISNIDALNIRLENQVQTWMGSQSQDGPSHVPPAFKNFSMSQKEKTLKDLVQDQWLCFTPDGNIGLGVRSLLDLRSWFHNNDVPSCDICNEPGVKAELCQNNGCTVRIHSYCRRKKFSQRTVERVCPGCGTEWQHPVSKTEALEEEEGEEKEEEEEEEEPNRATKSQPSLSSGSALRKRPRTCKTEKAGTAEAGPSEVSMPIPEQRMTTRKSARLR